MSVSSTLFTQPIALYKYRFCARPLLSSVCTSPAELRTLAMTRRSGRQRGPALQKGRVRRGGRKGETHIDYFQRCRIKAFGLLAHFFFHFFVNLLPDKWNTHGVGRQFWKVEWFLDTYWKGLASLIALLCDCHKNAVIPDRQKSCSLF